MSTSKVFTLDDVSRINNKLMSRKTNPIDAKRCDCLNFIPQEQTTIPFDRDKIEKVSREVMAKHLASFNKKQ